MLVPPPVGALHYHGVPAAPPARYAQHEVELLRTEALGRGRKGGQLLILLQAQVRQEGLWPAGKMLQSLLSRQEEATAAAHYT